MNVSSHRRLLRAQMWQFRHGSLLMRLRHLLQRIPVKPVDINCLCFLEYTGIPPCNSIFSRAGCEVRRATLEDLPGITKCQNTESAFLKRFQSNDECVVAVANGEIVGYEWFCDKASHLEERYSYRIDIQEDAIYAYDAFILQEHRLSGIWLKFKTVYLRELMQSLHKRRVITMVDGGNRMSMSTHLRFGFKLVRKVFVLRLFGKSIFWERKGISRRSAFLPRTRNEANSTVRVSRSPLQAESAANEYSSLS